MKDLSIVIVTWNARGILLDCLASIDREVRSRPDERRIDTETLVVDNGSLDGSVEAVRERFPWAEVIALPENLGFAAGNNVGLRRSKGRHVVLLNNDTIALHDSLEKCVRYLDAHPDVGIVGLQLLNPDGTKQNCIHNFPSLATEIVPKGLLEMLFPRRFPSKRYHHSSPIEVEAVLGACLFARREVLDAVGLMPEDYFLFLEETDWCLRIKEVGWRVVHVPDAYVIHMSGASRKKVPAETRIEFHRSLYHFFRKNRGTPHAVFVITLRVLKAILYVVAGAPLVVLSRHRRDRWWHDWKVLWWHLCGCPKGEGLARIRNPDAGRKI